MQDEKSWIYKAPACAERDIDAHLAAIRRDAVPLHEITLRHFPLPSIAADLAKLADELENGRGFALIRGLRLDDRSEEDISRLYWGLGTHFGRMLSQNARGELLGHIRAVAGLDFQKNPDVRGYHTNADLQYHSDNCDIVTLLCLRPAQQGGISSLVSATAI